MELAKPELERMVHDRSEAELDLFLHALGKDPRGSGEGPLHGAGDRTRAEVDGEGELGGLRRPQTSPAHWPARTIP